MGWFTIILTSTVVAAAVSLVGSWFMQNRQIHAEVVSKARHQWIQEVRSLLSEYITEIDSLRKDIDDIHIDEDEFLKLPYVKQLRPRVKTINTLCNKIILYFGESKVVDGNEEVDQTNVDFNEKITDLNESVNLLYKSCIKDGKYFNKRGINSAELEEEISQTINTIEEKTKDLIKESSKYIKTEWYNTKNQK